MNDTAKHTMRGISMKIRSVAREQALSAIAAASRMRGIDCLSREASISLCRLLGYDYAAGIPTTMTIGDGVHALEVLASGVVRINRRSCLYADFGNRAATLNLARPKQTIEHAVALWSHPKWLGFHHFLTELFPKICKLRETLGPELDGARLCYPMIHRRYEEELLEMAGIHPDRVIDSRAVGGLLTKRLTFVPMNGWFGGNPNAQLVRKQFVADSAAAGPERLYLMRAGRRKCLNEAGIIERLRQLDFQIVDESPRSIREQIALYRDARILVGPHGSAFSNMIWAKPGLRVVELVPSTFDVPYHRELSASLGHHYTKILCANGFHSTKGTLLDFRADVPRTLETVEQQIAQLEAE